MATHRKGLKDIRTMRAQVSRFRAKTPYGALIQLAQLAQRRARLVDEMRRWEERIEQINSRLEEVGKIEKWLYGFVDPPGKFSGGNKDGKDERQFRSEQSKVNSVKIGY